MKKVLVALVFITACTDTVEIPFAGPTIPIPPPIIPCPPPPSPSPDLRTEFAMSDTTPAPRSIITLHATVTNEGDGPSLPTTVRFYESADSIIDDGDSALWGIGIGRLNGGSSSKNKFNHQLADEEATYYFGACVQPRSNEKNSDNNCSAAVETVVERSDSGSGSGN